MLPLVLCAIANKPEFANSFINLFVELTAKEFASCSVKL